ncbi:uncharacterized protein BYT42DRAFT_534964 [Radiomyces spectabilis]|uniref:uncharacterized protein n=1 Tax=Radiomyces spectabilis TaxID=64574 RepID=UPI00221E7700|nr:uncharacterized protein BYT42DRAFT_534964 [Radiomyces spectabilis]KAI8376532.1 hypothetical protein BYT42DRAFT_534964 [Radiomyces spectabilis]
MSASHTNGYQAIPDNEAVNNSESAPLNANSHYQNAKWFFIKRYLRRHITKIILVLLAIVSLVLFLIAMFVPSTKPFPSRGNTVDIPVNPGISESAMQSGLAHCQRLQKARKINVPSETRKNPRAGNAPPVLLTHATVWDGEGNVQHDVDILLQDGVIRNVQRGLKVTDASVKIIDVKGHIVSPGLVDMHSHIGLASWPALEATADTNEMTMPLVPFVRSLDAFNPSDKAIRIVASGGVTTVLVLPGSSNLMGGEAFTFKLRPMPTTSNEDMLVQSKIDEDQEAKWRWMKMACGENPKRNYGRRGQMPSTRLGEAYLFRQKLAEAQQLMFKQDDWCSAAENLDEGRLETRFPEDLSLESLVALLRGDVLLNVHCYETHDIEAMIRHSLEFNFTISAFHHALDAYRIPDILRRARNNITIATFADKWGYKKEAFQATPHAPKILRDAGITVALKSDHPVLNSQHLIFEAAKATHYGLSAQEAFKTVTSVPAKALGLGHRVGSLKVGYDADVVIWDREPLELGASPLQVFIDGVPLFDERPIAPVKEEDKPVKAQALSFDYVKDQVQGAKNFRLTNVGQVMLHDKVMQGPVDVVVEDGAVTCAAADCHHAIATMNQFGNALETIDTQGGYVIPGLIAVGSSLGMVEIPSESSTSDGTVRPSVSHDAKAVVEAVDGLKLGTRHLEEAYKGGVLTSITAPISSNVVAGVSVAFKTGADSVLSEGAVIAPAVALHLQIGEQWKCDSFPTISSQVAYIRQILTENIKENNYYGQASRGDIPTVIKVNNKDEIASIIRLKKSHFPSARFVILGGAESHLVASHLAEAQIPVILQPALCTPEHFESIHCLTGAPLTNGTAAHVLQRHGVKIGIAVTDDAAARNLAWDAGWLSVTSPHSPLALGDITEAEAVRFVTSNLQEIFGLQSYNSLSMDDSFVVWSGNPFHMHSRPMLAHSKTEGIQVL